MTDVHGEVAPGYEAVREAFAANFDRHGEVGAACALYRDGQLVVDLWAGVADGQAGTPWAEDTLQLVFSTTKGATAVCALLLAERGELDLDAPVADYWPEFKAASKGDVPVRWLLCHRSGLPTVDGPITPAEVFAWDPIVAALAAQEPFWEPGTAHGYHALTYGWLVGEVVRRVSGRDIGTYFADEVAGPLGLDFHIGLPAALEARVARLEQLPALGQGRPDVDLEQLPEAVRAIAAAYLDPTSLTNRALSVTTPALDYNDPELHRAQIPAANGITTARSLARLYAALVGEVDGVRILAPGTVDRARTPQAQGPDRVLQVPTSFGLGFMLNSMFSPLLGSASFGHPGAGGSLGFADVDHRIGFGYVMNKMQQNLAGDPRTQGLIAAARACLG